MESFRQQLRDHIPIFSQIEDVSLDSLGQQIVGYVDQLLRHNESLKNEIQVHKQQLGNQALDLSKIISDHVFFKNIDRPSSADSSKRIFGRQSQDKQIREVSQTF